MTLMLKGVSYRKARSRSRAAKQILLSGCLYSAGFSAINPNGQFHGLDCPFLLYARVIVAVLGLGAI